MHTYNRGDVVGVRQAFGSIELVIFHSYSKRKDSFNAFLNFDMSTRHRTCQQTSSIISTDDLIYILNNTPTNNLKELT